MKISELSKAELVDLTTRLLKNIDAYPMMQHIVSNFLLARWQKKQDFLLEESKKYMGIDQMKEWWKIQKEMDSPQNDITYCTTFDEPIKERFGDDNT